MIPGHFDIVRLGATIGRATEEPGWRWSEHAGRLWGEALYDIWIWAGVAIRLEATPCSDVLECLLAWTVAARHADQCARDCCRRQRDDRARKCGTGSGSGL